MSDATIKRLRDELAQLDAAIAGLDGLPEAQKPLRQQREAKARELARLEGRAAPGGTYVDQSGQSGGVSFGAFNEFGGIRIGDVVGRDKITGPIIYGEVNAGRDVNLAAGPQTIVNAGGAPPPPHQPPSFAEPLTPPLFRLALADQGGRPADGLAVGAEAQLRLEWAGAAGDLPALTLLAAGDGVTWLSGTRAELRAGLGRPPRLPQWPFVAERAGPLTLQVLVLSGATLLQALDLTVSVAGTTESAVLSGSANTPELPERHVAVLYDLATPPGAGSGGDALTLFFSRGGETLRLVLIEPGQSWEVALPLTDHDLATLAQRAHEGLREIVFQASSSAFTAGVEIPPGVADLALRKLARHGAALWEGLLNPPGASSDVHALREHLRARSRGGPLRITVVGHRVALPWAALYDGDPAGAIRADGFWGFRHQVAAQPLHGRRRAGGYDSRLGPARGLPALLALNLELERELGAPVIAEQRRALAPLGLAAREVNSEDGLRDALAAGSDAALIYLCGHMGSPLRQVVGPTVDMDEVSIELSAMGAALTLADLRRVAPVGLEPRLRAGPLVVLNACSSGELTPLSFGGLVPYLLDQGARVVVGTSVEAPAHFAAAFGPALVVAMLRDGLTAGEALRATRARFLEQHHNLLGLLYSLYGHGGLCAADT